MGKKLVLISVLLALLCINIINATPIFVTAEMNFDAGDIPDDVYVQTYACQSIGTCKDGENINNNVHYFKYEGVKQCKENLNDPYYDNLEGFLNCLDEYKTKKIPTNGKETVKYVMGFDYSYIKDSGKDFGLVSYHHTKGDSYIPTYIRRANIWKDYEDELNLVEYMTYLDIENFEKLNFEKKDEKDITANIASSELANIENVNGPIQVDVVTDVKNTICSPLSWGIDTNLYPIPNNIPDGYSDLSTTIELNFDVESLDSSNSYHQGPTIIEVGVGNCVQESSFSWKPSEKFAREEVKISVTSDIIDKQIMYPKQDFITSLATIYPNSLENMCWVKSDYNFTLTNQPNPSNPQDLDAKDVNIMKGESLYATFSAGSWCGEDPSVPNDFKWELYFDNQKIDADTQNFNQDTPGSFSIDLTQKISDLESGSYDIKLKTEPILPSGFEGYPFTQTKQLNLLNVNYVNYILNVKNSSKDNLENANVKLELIEPEGSFAEEINYEKTLKTNNNGNVNFNNQLYRGEYKLEVSKANYNTITDTFKILSDTTQNIVLNRNNYAPNIELPNNKSADIRDDIIFNLYDYVNDVEEDEKDLTYNFEKEGDYEFNFNQNTGQITISSDNVLEGNLKVIVKDTNGLNNSDKMDINFFKNYKPNIKTFSISRREGEEPLNVIFNVDVDDVESDIQNCSIDFGDGNTTWSSNCEDLNKIPHTYMRGDYSATLIVEDSFNEPVQRTIDDILVYQKNWAVPKINDLKVLTDDGTNDVSNNLTISWDATHPDGLGIQCELYIDSLDKKYTNIDCSDDNIRIEDFNQIGNTKFYLTATDTQNQSATDDVTKTFNQRNIAPTINTFNVDPQLGYGNLTTNIEYDVTDPNNDDLICTIDLGYNGQNINIENCSSGIEQHTFNLLGKFNITMAVYDGEEIVSSSPIQVEILENTAPKINEFSANPTSGIEELNTNFTINVSDNENDELTCIIDFGDGSSTQTINNCNYHILPYNYDIEGKYYPTLTLMQNDGTQVTQTIDYLEVLSKEEAEPVIEYFTLDSSNGNIIPTDIELEWNAIHPQNLDINCSLSYNNITQNLNCNDASFTINNYNITGTTNFELFVTDGIYNTSQTQSILLGKPEDLSLKRTQLNLPNNNIKPGDIKFSILTQNETLVKREVKIKPIIICDGVRNTLKESNDYLKTRAISRSEFGHYEFEFIADTNDFELSVPIDKNCKFDITLVDEYGTNINLEDNIRFSYPKEEEVETSIRGTAVDVTDFMSSTITDKINRGYNSVDFNLVNNKQTSKEMQISMISPKLNIDYKTQFELNPGQTRKISMPVYINKNVEKGKYPVRYSVKDNNNKQTRYSYIVIN